MALRKQLELVDETLSEVAVAAEEKYWEGLDLLTSGRTGAGIYLMGYTAEILLKIAAFRFDGARPDDLMTARLPAAKQWMKQHAPNVVPEGYHGLDFWLRYLDLRREQAGRMLPRGLRGELAHRVGRIYVVWWVEMRYRADRATILHGSRIFQDVTWLRENFVQIWS
jgi:hypothetical protein